MGGNGRILVVFRPPSQTRFFGLPSVSRISLKRRISDFLPPVVLAWLTDLVVLVQISAPPRLHITMLKKIHQEFGEFCQLVKHKNWAARFLSEKFKRKARGVFRKRKLSTWKNFKESRAFGFFSAICVQVWIIIWTPVALAFLRTVNSFFRLLNVVSFFPVLRFRFGSGPNFGHFCFGLLNIPWKFGGSGCLIFQHWEGEFF